MKIKFNASDVESITKKVSQYVHSGNSYVLEIKKSVKHRSLPQNKFYWSVVVSLFSQHTGYTKDEAHEKLSSLHLKYERVDKDGVIETFVRSTTKLNTLEFEQYIEQCRVFMWHMFSVRVPLPNEVSDDFLIQMENIYNY